MLKNLLFAPPLRLLPLVSFVMRRVFVLASVLGMLAVLSLTPGLFDSTFTPRLVAVHAAPAPDNAQVNPVYLQPQGALPSSASVVYNQPMYLGADPHRSGVVNNLGIYGHGQRSAEETLAFQQQLLASLGVNAGGVELVNAGAFAQAPQDQLMAQLQNQRNIVSQLQGQNPYLAQAQAQPQPQTAQQPQGQLTAMQQPRWNQQQFNQPQQFGNMAQPMMQTQSLMMPLAQQQQQQPQQPQAQWTPYGAQAQPMVMPLAMQPQPQQQQQQQATPFTTQQFGGPQQWQSGYQQQYQQPPQQQMRWQQPQFGGQQVPWASGSNSVSATSTNSAPQMPAIDPSQVSSMMTGLMGAAVGGSGGMSSFASSMMPLVASGVASSIASGTGPSPPSGPGGLPGGPGASGPGGPNGGPNSVSSASSGGASSQSLADLATPTKPKPTSCGDSDYNCQFLKACYSCYTDTSLPYCSSCIGLLQCGDDQGCQMPKAKTACTQFAAAGVQQPSACKLLAKLPAAPPGGPQ